MNVWILKVIVAFKKLCLKITFSVTIAVIVFITDIHVLFWTTVIFITKPWAVRDYVMETKEGLNEIFKNSWRNIINKIDSI